MTTQDYIRINNERLAALSTSYDPIAGDSTDTRRVPCTIPGTDRTAYIPLSMASDPRLDVATSIATFEKLRVIHDFEFWCARCVIVRDKLTGADIPFVLNRPQRRLVAALESMRLASKPIRIIMLKARQWGGSTLVQMYMAWIQMVHRRNWNSLICAHVKDTAASIRGMYSKMLANYPSEIWTEECDKPEFRPFERTQNVRVIPGRGCKVTVASAENQEAVRGGDYAMAHLSETAFWPATQQRSPEQFIRAVCGSIPLQPYSLIAMESTANGVGNFFHSEWVRCSSGKGDKMAIFVPWYQIDIYSMPVDDIENFINSLSEYERTLFINNDEVTLEKLFWYRTKASEYSSDQQMKAEFPSYPEEAFTDSDVNVFPSAAIDRLRAGCSNPCFIGDIFDSGNLMPDSRAGFKIWHRPVSGYDYVVAVDIGGRSRNSDWSVIAVLSTARKPKVAAQWRGHIDHDLLVDKCMEIAHFYNNALLVVESNTLESEYSRDADSSFYLLSRLTEQYPNMYYRQSFFPGDRIASLKPGFHTNRSTKAIIIANLIRAVRDGLYIESDTEACNELAVYRQMPNGAYAAAPGRHDDILMTRAIALYVIQSSAPVRTSGRCLPLRPSW